jgi:23S rRNA (uracil1939-C5)-methyltransferase
VSAVPQTLTIERLGQRGEGVARGAEGPVFVPYALAGEYVEAETSGERGKLLRVLAASPDRVAPICPYYGVCGGCAVQALRYEAYAAWKRGLLVDALAHAGVKADVAPLVAAHGQGRRRVTFHARGHVVGFMQARAHEIVEIAQCPVLAPALANALIVSRAIAKTLASHGKPLDILVTATLSGLDIDLHGAGKLAAHETQRLIWLAGEHDLARLSNHGAAIVTRREPSLAMGKAHVAPPPGAFLQATEAAEETLAALVSRAMPRARRVADLFSGVGTFALRLAAQADVHAVELSAPALAALAKAANNAQGLRAVTTEARDLFRRPLAGDELTDFDAVIFDPPRAGAQAQAAALAQSAVPTVVAVSCNAASFARDAAILTAGGYRLESVTPIDQFLYSAHVEIVGVFRKTPSARAKRKGLLG